MATISDFLNNLAQKGETNGIQNQGTFRPYLKKEKIKNIHATCCPHSEIEVYDFDECKEIVAQTSQLLSPKSCDGLKIDIANERIYFIEFKRWNEFIQWRLQPNTDHRTLIRQQIQRFQLDTKLHDSLLILNSLVYNNTLRFTTEERKLYRSTPKDMILLVDINPQASPIENIAMALNALSLVSSNPALIIEKYLETELRSIPSSDLSNIQNIVLKNCETIENYFSVI